MSDRTETFTLPEGLLEQVFLYLSDRSPVATQLAHKLAAAHKHPAIEEPAP